MLKNKGKIDENNCNYLIVYLLYLYYFVCKYT
jgi:hypothetical protein